MRSIPSCKIVINTTINQRHYTITLMCIYSDVDIIPNYKLNNHSKIKTLKNKKTFNNMKEVNNTKLFNNMRHTKFKFFKLNS